ncbi:hypothetical protein M409DRAFT_15661 [Zasmidium cellare ATCC 36951]|uniref:SET domain-containing protein n=1 Tax=Zasmidium cellare ATCC 36951 TaxID=1080233 RepID=A0A6A6D6X3_ZASCE|nr:uncharacterized protein M409DRAFT_15661 [Zasmidium cellare ATCC 36951]KAF2173376.1 hypothetical protein M409DRAFT_15661 [Zasmidium cellare ATCC 36951]
MDDLFEIRRTATKGCGVFAKKAISSYTIIVRESPVIALKCAPGDTAAKIDASIEQAFRNLSKKDQASELQLHEGSHPNAKTKVTRIFHANGFGNEHVKELYLTKSRFNHSCVPNAFAYEDGESSYLQAIRQIAPGEEITISYLPRFEEAMTSRQRATVLHLHYKFECRCAACWPPHQRWKSDVRRQLIGFLSYALEGENAPDFRPLDICHPLSWVCWPPQPTPSGRVLTPAQEIEYNFLLANLREAEGWPDYLVAEGYLHAATKLAFQQSEYQQSPATQDIVFLEAARCIEAWYQKGLELEKKFYPPAHPQIRDGTMAWENTMSRFRCLQYLRMTNSLKARDEHGPSESGGNFAVRIQEGDGTLTLLSQEDTAGLIWQRVKRL